MILHDYIVKVVLTHPQIPLELCDWPSGRARRASINNFGFGGTNAHVILDGAPRTTKDQRAMCQPHTPKLFLLSAHDEKTLRRMAADLTSHLDQYEEMISLSDLAYTLGQRRTKFDWSLAASARSISRLSLSLSDETIRPVQASGGSQPRLGFVFNGQGAQWFAMGRELMNVYPTYLKTLQECDEAIASYGSKWSLIGESNSIGVFRFTQLVVNHSGFPNVHICPQTSCDGIKISLEWTK